MSLPVPLTDRSVGCCIVQAIAVQHERPGDGIRDLHETLRTDSIISTSGSSERTAEITDNEHRLNADP